MTIDKQLAVFGGPTAIVANKFKAFFSSLKAVSGLSIHTDRDVPLTFLAH